MITILNIRYKLLFALSLIIFLIILFFGLSGNGSYFSNDVTWIKYEPGIRFGNYGIAYALIDNILVKDSISKAKAFSIEMAVKPENFDLKGFKLILTLHDGKDSNQLIVGQWQSHIIAMNGDDYTARRKVKRISADIISNPSKKMLLTITTGDEGTKLYLDGKLIETESDLTLRIPEENMLYLTLGNSVYGNNSWRGEVYSVALYGDILVPEIIQDHFNAWSNNRTYTFKKDRNPLLFFTFDEREGTETIDQVTGVQKLNLPVRFHILKKRFISPPWRDFQLNKSFFIDFIINLLGFIPLGFALCALFIKSGGLLQKKALLFSVVSCLVISLCIEIAQAWIPSRSSQGLDLILNTVGAFIGTLPLQIKNPSL